MSADKQTVYVIRARHDGRVYSNEPATLPRDVAERLVVLGYARPLTEPAKATPAPAATPAPLTHGVPEDNA